MLRLPCVIALALLACPVLIASAQPPASQLLGDAKADGKTDDTAALQQAIDASAGVLRLPAGRYRITKPITIELDRVGYTSITGDGAVQIIMAGPGPALRFVGTHEGTAAPKTFQPNVWQRQRMPAVDGLEIVGAHPEACGVEATGTMQLTLTRLAVRDVLHAVHLVKRNRNVTLSECHLYHNRGVGVYLDSVNLHQINIANCHISYNQAGGVVVRNSELRNLQIGTCDIEGNMGGPDSQPTANVLLDSSGGSIAEVAIVGCTIQHAHQGPGSANIRIDGKSVKRPNTEELRHGHVTIANNVLSDVQVNLELQNVRGATITGNTMWQAYTHNMTLTNCDNVVFANNVCERNPRYDGADPSQISLGLVLTDCNGCTLSGNLLQGITCKPAALVLKNCQRTNLLGNTILDYGDCGLLLEKADHCRVSDSLIRREAAGESTSVRLTSGRGNQVIDNLLGSDAEIAKGAAVTNGNVVD